MGSFSIWHWVIVLIIVMLVFGTKKLRNIGSDLGSAVRDFKKGLNGDEAEQSKPAEQLKADAPAPADAVKSETHDRSE